MPSPVVKVPVPVHSKTAQSVSAPDPVDPLRPVGEDGVGVAGHLAHVGGPRRHRVAEHAAGREERGEVVRARPRDSKARAQASQSRPSALIVAVPSPAGAAQALRPRR